jgi:sugar diacid utilization regulator
MLQPGQWQVAAAWGIGEDTLQKLDESCAAMLSAHLKSHDSTACDPASAAKWARACGLLSYTARPFEGDGFQGLLLLGGKDSDSSPDVGDLALATIEKAMETAVAKDLAVAAIAAREEEIRALHEISKEISALGSPDRVLHLICQKCAELLNVEISYIALADKQQQELRMLMTYGISTSWRDKMWMRFGEGIGGTVAATRKPLIAPDYSAYPHVTRPDLQDMVNSEGIKAIVAVPMILGKDVTGVIYAADRRPNKFTDRDARLLQGMADQATIAIANSELYERERQQIEVDDRLTAVVLRDGDFQTIAQALHELVGNPTAIYDSRLNLLACHPLEPAAPGVYEAAMPYDLLNQQAGTDQVGDAPRQGVILPESPDADRAFARAVAPVVSGNEPLGYVHIIQVERRIDPAALRIAERAGVIIALRMMRLRAEAEMEQRLRGELLDDLLDENEQTVKSALRRAAHLGHDASSPAVVLVVEVEDAGIENQAEAQDPILARRSILRAIEVIAESHGVHAIVAPKGGQMLCVVSANGTSLENSAAQFGRLLAKELQRQMPRRQVVVSMGGIATTLADIKESYREAGMALSLHRDLDLPGGFVEFGQFGVLGLLGGGDGARLNSFVRKRLGALIDQDGRSRGALVRTLKCYLACSGNKVETARRLTIHISTLKYRLSRIETILEVDLSDSDTRFELHLAARILETEQLLRSGEKRG